MSYRSIIAGCLVLSLSSQIQAESGCHANGWTKEAMIAWKTAEFPLQAGNGEQRFNQLRACLASTDPEVRDGVAYEAYVNILRNNKVDIASVNSLYETLFADIKAGKNDPAGVYLPFAVLVMAEVVRVDRISPYLTDEARAEVVTLAANYLSSVNDYRGFNDKDGWRHHVAHGADLILQLALNKAVTKPQLDELLKALASQISPPNHSYTFSEPKRLATPAAYIYLRNEHSLEEWQRWLDGVTKPKPLADWSSSYKSEAGLIKRHNVTAFLTSFYALVGESQNAKLKEIKQTLVAAMKKVG